jgi:thiamine biosynthesis lipoprotein
MKHSVILLLLLPGFVCAGELLRLEDSADAMGTTYTLVLYGEDQEAMQAAAEAAFEEVRRLDRMLSNYRPGSEWSEVNRNAAVRPGTWGFYKGTGRLPAKEEIAGVLPAVGYRNVILDEKAQTVRFAKEGVEMDPGGIGKGYAVDHMVEKLKAAHIAAAMVSAGGSSIYGLGAPPNDPGWKVQIRHPRDWSRTIEEFFLKNESISTSGDYEKFFEAGGKLFSHIMDPRTGYPARGTRSVSVVAPSALDSEAWTKPFFIHGRQWAARHKPEGFRVFLCEDKADVTCAWLQ